MRLLVTGGCGFVGSNLAAYGLTHGANVTVFDNLSRYGAAKNLDWLRSLGDVDFVFGDIRKMDEVDRLIGQKRFDGIFHLAGQVAMTVSVASPRYDFEINTGGTFNLLDAVRRLRPETPILYSSTNKVYGDFEKYEFIETPTRYLCPQFPNGFDENTPIDMHSPYGVSKGAADQYVLDFARIFGMSTVVFRHSSMFGGRQYATFDQGWIGWFCQKAWEQKLSPDAPPFTISGNGKQVRDVLHVDDVVRLYYTALQKIDKLRGRAFNIGGGIDNSLSLLELFAMLEQKLGIKLRYDELPPRQSDQKIFVADISLIRRLTGWQPELKLESGVNSALDWAKTNANS